MVKGSYRFKTFHNKCGKYIDSYVLDDITYDRAQRHFLSITHNRMVVAIGDPIYKDDANFDLRVSEDKSTSIILIDGEIEYSLRFFKIDVYDDYFREYRGYTITILDNNLYISNTNGRVIKALMINTESIDKDFFDNIYDIIDNDINKA